MLGKEKRVEGAASGLSRRLKGAARICVASKAGMAKKRKKSKKSALPEPEVGGHDARKALGLKRLLLSFDLIDHALST